MLRLPEAIAPIVPRLTPVIRAILRWLDFPSASNCSTCATRCGAIMFTSRKKKSPATENNFRRRALVDT
jgi:hypothetical protein